MVFVPSLTLLLRPLTFSSWDKSPHLLRLLYVSARVFELSSLRDLSFLCSSIRVVFVFFELPYLCLTIHMVVFCLSARLIELSPFVFFLLNFQISSPSVLFSPDHLNCPLFAWSPDRPSLRLSEGGAIEQRWKKWSKDWTIERKWYALLRVEWSSRGPTTERRSTNVAEEVERSRGNHTTRWREKQFK